MLMKHNYFTLFLKVDNRNEFSKQERREENTETSESFSEDPEEEFPDVKQALDRSMIDPKKELVQSIIRFANNYKSH